MSTRSMFLPADVHEYALSCASREPDVLKRLRQETSSRPEAEMQIGPEQGQLMGLLANLIGARKCIELGTYTGYSALAVMLALPKDATLIACDVSEAWTSIGRRFWREAGVDSRITLRIQPALKTLDELLARGEQNTFDFAFIDADKTNYIAYFEKLMLLLRTGGLIAVDNTLGMSGIPVIHGSGAHSAAVRAFNEHVHRDERVDLALVPIGEGLTLLRKR